MRFIVLKGEARLRFKATLMEMLPGDFVDIPAHTKHRVEWTTPDDLAGRIFWLAVYYGEGNPAHTS